ncbi:nucleotidyltransferase family protein [Changchengzhania lutea]|uniref:nucleotidyltransferase family protein n=1 Tax=Changchengzhania lutea TaxID=2049305 RepID=UPI00115D66E2|nr:nucleotidyltransferase family protein [Changchengzhania lutea]
MLNKSSNIIVVVLAAGASTRMGMPKQLLPWANTTLLNHSIDTVSKLDGLAEIIVVLGAHYSTIKNHITNRQLTILNNEKWQSGLGASIACATKHIESLKHETHGILFTLVDQPLIPDEYLQKLIHNFKDFNDIIATRYEDKKTGVPALFGIPYFKELSNLNNDFGAKQIMKTYESRIKTLKLDVNSVDLDTQKEYNDLYKQHFENK